jgi:hypothetical protein
MKRTTTFYHKKLQSLPSFVVYVKIGACLLYSKVVDDGRNEIMAMTTRVKSVQNGVPMCL